MWGVCDSWRINASALDCSSPHSASLSYSDSWFPPLAPALPGLPVFQAAGMSCPQESHGSPGSSPAVLASDFMENHPWQLAPGNNHHPPKPWQGGREAGKCMVPESNVLEIEPGSNEGMETHSRKNPSCQKKPWHHGWTIIHAKAGTSPRDHSPQVTCAGTRRWREKVLGKAEEAKYGWGEPVKDKEQQRKQGSKEWQREAVLSVTPGSCAALLGEFWGSGCNLR